MLSGPARVRVWLTDAPIDEIDHLWIDLARVDLLLDGGEAVTVLDRSLRLDLLALRNGVMQELGVAELPAGRIHQVRMLLTGAEVERGGVLEPVVVPSGEQTGLKLPVDLNVEEGRRYDLIVDFDAEHSLIYNRGRGWMLKPVLSAGFAETVNSAPVAESAEFVVPFQQQLSAALSAFDEDGDSLTWAVLAEPAVGSLQLDAGQGDFVYQPAVGFVGETTFAFGVFDGTEWSAPATVTLVVQAPPMWAPGIRFEARSMPPLADDFEGPELGPDWWVLQPDPSTPSPQILDGRLRLDTGWVAAGTPGRVLGVGSVERFWPQSFSVTAEVSLHGDSQGEFFGGLVLAEDVEDAERMIAEFLVGFEASDGHLHFMIAAVGPDGTPDMQRLLRIPGEVPADRSLHIEIHYDLPAQVIHFEVPELGFSERFADADIGAWARRLILLGGAGMLQGPLATVDSRLVLDVQRVETTLRQAGVFRAAFAPEFHEGLLYATGVFEAVAVPFLQFGAGLVELTPYNHPMTVPADGEHNIHVVLAASPEGGLHTIYTTARQSEWEAIAPDWTTMDFLADRFVANGPATDYSINSGQPPETYWVAIPEAVSALTNPVLHFGALPGAAALFGFECRIDGRAWTPCASPLALENLREGVHYAAVRAIDMAGNIDPVPATHRWRVSLPPETRILSGPPAHTANDMAEFILSADKAPVSFECALDGAAFEPCPERVQFAGLAEGPHHFRARAVDAWGVADPEPAEAAWVIDQTPPRTTILSGPLPEDDRSSVVFEFVADEPATWLCELWSGTQTLDFRSPCESPYVFRGLAADTEYEFRVRATDLAGNQEPDFRRWTWLVRNPDNPDTFLLTTPGQTSTSREATFSFASDHGIMFECQLDGLGFEPCTSPHTVRDLSYGSHVFAVRAIDANQNVDLTPATFAWTVLDVTPPRTALEQVPDKVTNAVTATFGFSSNEPGSFECRVNAGAWTGCISPYVVGPLSGGEQLFEVRAIDLAGNVDPSPSRYAWQIDESMPSLRIVSAPPRKGSDPWAVLVFETDRPADIECALDQGGFVPCVSPVQYGPLSVGLHHFEVRARGTDGTGALVSAEAHFEVVDPDAPDTILIAGPEGVVHPAEVYIEFEGVNASQFECNSYFENPRWQRCVSPMDFGALGASDWLADGPWYLEIRAVGMDGEPDPTPLRLFWIVRRDEVAPTIEVIAAPGEIHRDPDVHFALGTDLPATFECSLDGDVMRPCPSDFSLRVSEPGPHILAVRAMSLALVPNPDPVLISWEYRPYVMPGSLADRAIHEVFGDSVTTQMLSWTEDGVLQRLSGEALSVAEAPWPGDLSGQGPRVCDVHVDRPFQWGSLAAVDMTLDGALVSANAQAVTEIVSGVGGNRRYGVFGDATFSETVGPREGLWLFRRWTLRHSAGSADYESGPDPATFVVFEGCSDGSCSEFRSSWAAEIDLPAGVLSAGVWEWELSLEYFLDPGAVSQVAKADFNGTFAMDMDPAVVQWRSGQPRWVQAEPDESTYLQWDICDPGDVQAGIVAAEVKLAGEPLNHSLTQGVLTVEIPATTAPGMLAFGVVLTDAAGSESYSEWRIPLDRGNQVLPALHRSEGLLTTLSPALGVAAPEAELFMDFMLSGEGGTTIRYRQHRNGFVFQDGALLVELDSDGNPVELHSALVVTETVLEPTGNIDAARALALSLVLAGSSPETAGAVARERRAVYILDPVADAYVPFHLVALEADHGYYVAFIDASEGRDAAMAPLPVLGGVGDSISSVNGRYSRVSDGSCSWFQFGEVSDPDDDKGFTIIDCPGKAGHCLATGYIRPKGRAQDSVLTKAGHNYAFDCGSFEYGAMTLMTWNKYISQFAQTYAGFGWIPRGSYQFDAVLCGSNAGCAYDIGGSMKMRIKEEHRHNRGLFVHESVHFLQYAVGASWTDYLHYDGSLLTSLYTGARAAFLEGTAEAVACNVVPDKSCSSPALSTLKSSEPHTAGKMLESVAESYSDSSFDGYFKGWTTQGRHELGDPRFLFRGSALMLRLLPQFSVVHKNHPTYGRAFDALRRTILNKSDELLHHSRYGMLLETGYLLAERVIPLGTQSGLDPVAVNTAMVGMRLGDYPVDEGLRPRPRANWSNWRTVVKNPFVDTTPFMFYWGGFSASDLLGNELNLIPLHLDTVGTWHSGQRRHKVWLYDLVRRKHCALAIGDTEEPVPHSLWGNRHVIGTQSFSGDGLESPLGLALFKCGLQSADALIRVVPVAAVYDGVWQVGPTHLDLLGQAKTHHVAIFAWNDVASASPMILAAIGWGVSSYLADLLRESVDFFRLMLERRVAMHQMIFLNFSGRLLGCAITPKGDWTLVIVPMFLILGPWLYWRRRPAR